MNTHGPDLNGGCHCGSIRFHFETLLPTFTPRACDCSFCTSHGAAWISGANGSLFLDLNPGSVGRYRQGSGQAEFLFCKRCGVLVAVAYTDSRTYAAINARSIAEAERLEAAKPASLQKLSPQEKASRWKYLWIPRVVFPESEYV